MSDSTDDVDWWIPSDWVYEPRINHSEIRNTDWVMKNGETIEIGKMSDTHLLNAYKKIGDEDLFKEMVVRLFESRVANYLSWNKQS